MINFISLALVWAIFSTQNTSLWTFSSINNNESVAPASSIQLLPTQAPTQETLTPEVNIKTKNDLVINSLTITAYSSEPNQTDNDPFITASGKPVHSGIAASNFLPFGTKIKIPEIFGDKVFTIEDRMAKKHSDKIDIWFSSEIEALRFGIKTADIIILN
jgi:3D (Asp-Asp-Asp) domain-containing protein